MSNDQHEEPGSIRLRPGMFAGAAPIDNKWGGNKTLLAAQPKPGIFLSAWHPEDEYAWRATSQMFLRQECVVVLVVSTAHEGLPAVSMHIQPTVHVTPSEFQSKHAAVQGQHRRAGMMATPRNKIIIPPGFKR